ncbi:helix-turn-helix domain-containing protein [Nocardioides sp. GCM10030258]|uniref:helix-turn-helix domain-containing protein n=1 Tax=unclassified Nocardioides TaxID=2615069 RepID=UPI00360EF8CD
MGVETNPEVSRLAGRVRALRVAAGLTQQEVADAIGVNRVTVARLEAGLHDLGSSRLGALAEALGVEPGAFWE